MNRDEGSPYQLSHIWDKLLVTSEKPEVIPVTIDWRVKYIDSYRPYRLLFHLSYVG